MLRVNNYRFVTDAEVRSKNGLILSPLCRAKLIKGEDKDQVDFVILQIKDQLSNSQATCLWPRETDRQQTGRMLILCPKRVIKGKFCMFKEHF